MRTPWIAFLLAGLVACSTETKTSTGTGGGSTGTDSAGTDTTTGSSGDSSGAPTTGGTDSGSGTGSSTTGDETEVSVEDSRSMCMGNPLLPDLDANPPPVAAPALMAQALGGGKVAVTETEYEDNCGYTLTPVVVADAGTVTITYDTTGDEADCICLFTIDYTLAGLPPGTWTIVSGALSAMVDVT